MSILAKNKQQITLVYSSNSNIAKRTLAYASSIDYRIDAKDISKSKLSNSIWVEIADQLNIPLGKLFSDNQPDASSLGNTDNYSTDDWLKLINKQPELLRYPIAITEAKTMIIKDPRDIYSFVGVDSAGLEHSPLST